MKRSIIDNLKNIRGWKTNRKIVVISVDDYGNVRLDSKQARENMDKAGLKVHTRFDAYDTLETRQDLEALYKVLTSVKDKHENHAVFTPFALPCNINFEAMAEEGYDQYIPETLPETYAKLEERHSEAYNGAWELWQEGIEKGIMAPQFHGREHLNLKVFEEKLEQRDSEVLTALKNRSYTSISDTNRFHGYTAAFGFKEKDELEELKPIVHDGLKKFKKVYGYRSISFTAPAQTFNPELELALKDEDVIAIDRPFQHVQFQPDGDNEREWNYTGKMRKSGLRTIVRNVVFEPTHDRGFDWVEHSMDQIAIAFRWNRPANISSHRVNFCGFIDEKNREKGLSELQRLLSSIVQRWTEVEFLSVEDLAGLIKKG